MAKMIRHDFGGIHDALNKMIIAEVKAALEQLPEKRIEGGSLCRVVVSPGCDYDPRDLCVEKVWIGDDGDLCFTGTEEHGNYIVDDDTDPWTENDDLLDITDFGYLIDQIAAKVEGDATYNLPNRSVTVCGYVAEHALKQEVEKTVTV